MQQAWVQHVGQNAELDQRPGKLTRAHSIRSGSFSNGVLPDPRRFRQMTSGSIKGSSQHAVHQQEPSLRKHYVGETETASASKTGRSFRCKERNNPEDGRIHLESSRKTIPRIHVLLAGNRA